MSKTPPKAKSWDQQVKWDMEWAKRKLREKGELPPMAILHSEHAIRVVMLDFTSDRAKTFSLHLLRLNTVAHNVYAASVLSEAWMAVYPIDIPDTDHPDVMPSERSDRVEVLMMATTNREDGRLTKRQIMSKILRDASGRISGFDELNEEELTAPEGRWLDIVPPHEPSEEHRRKAWALLKEAQKHTSMKEEIIHPPGKA